MIREGSDEKRGGVLLETNSARNPGAKFDG